MLLPNIIKLSQTMWELWAAQAMGFRREKYIMKKVSCLSCTRYTYLSLSMPLLNIIKNFQTIKNECSAQDFGYEIRSSDITRKRTKQELSSLHVRTTN